MAEDGERFYSPGDRKITLNFALSHHASIDPAVMLKHFSPDIFLIKITPLNPTYRAKQNNLESYINPFEINKQYDIVQELRQAGYEVIVSIGEVEENHVGSNCGQYLRAHLNASTKLPDGYTYLLAEK